MKKLIFSLAAALGFSGAVLAHPMTGSFAAQFPATNSAMHLLQVTPPQQGNSGSIVYNPVRNPWSVFWWAIDGNYLRCVLH